MGAFLRRDSSTASSIESQLSEDSVQNGSPETPSSSSSVPEWLAQGDGHSMPADKLHEIGTFAQVHTIMPGENGAMMLLVGHRRLKRLKTVRTQQCMLSHAASITISLALQAGRSKQECVG